MNPTKNRKNLEGLIEDIRNFAYSYLEKYSPSKQQLKTYLFKKLIQINQKETSKKEVFDLIDTVISTLVDQKLLSDKYYSDTKSKAFYRKGYSLNKIRGKIIELIRICATFEFGIIINISQNGRTPKLVQRYIFSNVK